MFVSVAWHVPSDVYTLVFSAAGNISPKNASDIFPSLGISECSLPKLLVVHRFRRRKQYFRRFVGVTQAHTRSIASKMLWHIAWNCQQLCIPNCLLNPKEIPRVLVKKSPSERGPKGGTHTSGEYCN